MKWPIGRRRNNRPALESAANWGSNTRERCASMVKCTPAIALRLQAPIEKCRHVDKPMH